MRNIVGISAFYHDAACCLLQEGRLVAAAEEERFSRIKHDPALPFNAFMYCLKVADLNITDVDLVAFYEDPEKKLERQIMNFSDEREMIFYQEEFNKLGIESKIRNILGYEGEIIFVDHHLSHAASSYFFSGFDDAAILTVDGVGEWATTTYGVGNQNGIRIFEEIRFPHSIGLLYSTITNYLGFEVNEGEYKVMGLAPYGNMAYVDKVRKLIINKDGGNFHLDMNFFDFRRKDRMFTDQLVELLEFQPRRAGTEIFQIHKDLARSLQFVLEEILLDKINYLHKITQSENLCLAGGVALNCVANGRIVRESPFKDVFIQPASSDAGGSIGAAAQAYFSLTKKKASNTQLKHVYVGPHYSNSEIAQALEATRLKFHSYISQQDKMLSMTAAKLSQGKVIGWFQGSMEFGPRALGSRSILADPRDSNMRDKINSMVKKREGFRPFAPVVLADKASTHFDLTHPSPFMLETCQVISPLALPAITHIDNSARVQTVNHEVNPLLTVLLEKFYDITQCPILLNTSFNIKNEPIVCSPYDAISCFVVSRLDGLVIGDFFLDRSENSLEVMEFILESIYKKQSGIRHNIYSFL